MPELGHIDSVSRGISRRQRHAVVGGITHRGIHAAVQDRHFIIRHRPVPDLIKQPLERLLLLPVSLL